MLKVLKELSLTIVGLIWGLGSVGCTTVLSVRSDPPGAAVFTQTVNGQRQDLGKTPFDMSYADLDTVAPLASVTGEMIPLSFEKEAFETSTLMVTAVRIGLASATINAKLKPTLDSSNTADRLLQYLHNAQKFANAGNYNRAIEEVDKAIEKEPKFIRAMSMKGSIYFVQNRYEDSLIWYEKALQLDNGFEEAVKMIAEIKKRKGAN